MRKTMKISALLLAILCLFTLASCAPKTADKAKEKMEKKDYRVSVTKAGELADLVGFDAKTEASVTCTKGEGEDAIGCTAIYYKDAEDAKKAYEDLKEAYEKALDEFDEAIEKATDEETKDKLKEDKKEVKDMKITRSGKIVIYGSKKAVNDFTGLF